MAKKAKRPTRRAKPARARGKSAPKRSGARMIDRRKNQPETLRIRAVEPALTVADLDRSIRFYTGVLGFIVGEKWNDDRGVLRGVMLKAGSCGIGLSQDDWAKGRDRKKGEGVRLWWSTAQDVDALATRIKAAGGHLTEEPGSQSWGSRSLSLDDPDGFHITIYRARD